MLRLILFEIIRKACQDHFGYTRSKQERVPFCYPHVAPSTLDVRARFVFHGSAAAKSTNPLPGFCFMWFFRLLVIRYVFRKYPSRYEQVVQALCESLADPGNASRASDSANLSVVIGSGALAARNAGSGPRGPRSCLSLKIGPALVRRIWRSCPI